MDLQACVVSLCERQYHSHTVRTRTFRAYLSSARGRKLEKHQALIVAHRDGHPHVHVIVNRVDAESGKAAGLSRSKLRLS